MYTCECGKSFNKPNSLNAHYSHCLIYRKGNPSIDRLKGKRNWNKGLTKDTDERVLKYSESFKNNIKSGITQPGFTGKKHSKEYKEKLSLKQAISYSGGLCKWIPYKKKDGNIVNLQGTWEVKFAEYLDSNDIEWFKPGNGKLEYSFYWIDDKGVKRVYTPDFYIPAEDKYYEIKGYWREKDRDKMKKVLEQNNIKIEIIQKKQMKELNLL